MLFLLILGPLVLYFCLPKDLQREIADWAGMIVGTLAWLAGVIWIISIVLQFLFGIPGADISPHPGQ